MTIVPKRFHSIPKQEFVLHTCVIGRVQDGMEVKPTVTQTDVRFIGRVDFEDTQITSDGHVVQFGKLFYDKNALNIEVKLMDYITNDNFKARIIQPPKHWVNQRTGKYLGSTTQIQIFTQGT